MKNTIDQKKCKQCKLCIAVCPVNLIGMDNNGQIRFIHERESICLECGQCMAICSTDAVKIGKYTYEKNLFKLPGNTVTYDNFYNFLANRRSVRNFKDKPVEKELIERILETLDFAPYGAAPNKVEISAITNRKIIETALPFIEEFLDNIVKWIENPIASFMIKHKKGPEIFNTIKNHLYPMAKLENYKLKYGDRITRNAPAILIFHASRQAEEHTDNALIYATFAMFAAQSLGLGASLIGIVPAAINKVEKLRHIFQIPGQHEAIISLIIGYPKYKYQKAIKREKKTIHWVN